MAGSGLAGDGQWRRPASAPPVPHVWRRFAGRAPAPGGPAPAFWIQDVSEDLVETVLEFLTREHLRDEETAVAVGLADDPQSVEDYCGMWRRAMQEQRVSLAAFTLGADGRPQLVGCNVLGVQRRGEAKGPEVLGEAARKMRDAKAFLEARADLWGRFPGADAALVGLGLWVARAFRGHRIGLQLLLARSELCAAVGLPISATFFSSSAAQSLAELAGFQLVAEMRYADYRVDGQLVFAGTKSPSAQFRVKSFQH